MATDLESLDKRVQELESKNKSSKLLGSSYSTVGTSDSDFVMKTKGKVKIQWGNKFIDLLKDGKINVDAEFIYEADSVGSKDGIYVLDDGETVVLKIGDNEITLVSSDVGTTYVSFMEAQETDAAAKYTAMTNIGFIYSSLSDWDSSSLQNGVIYVESEKKFYTVTNGSLEEFTIEFPNPFTEQFVIQKNDSDVGALYIVGEGKENSLAFDGFYIYVEDGYSYLESDSNIIYVTVGGSTNQVEVWPSKVVFNVNAVSSMFMSPNATENKGFRLYVVNGESTLEVDNLIVRNGITDGSVDMLYPVYWYYENNIILGAENEESLPSDDDDDDSDSDDEDDDGDGDYYRLDLAYTNKYEVGQTLYVYVAILDEGQSASDDDEDEDTDEDEDDGSGAYVRILLPLYVEYSEASDGSNYVYVRILEDQLTDTELDMLTNVTASDFKNAITFLVYQDGETITIRRESDDNVDLIEVSSIEDASGNDGVITRIGNIGELEKNENVYEDGETSEQSVEGYGIYSDNAAFLKARYTSDYELDHDDDSSKFASTEWVQDLLEDISYPDITITGDPNGYMVADGHNIDVTELIEALEKVASKYDPGYYYSSSASSGTPVDPVYWGTSSEGFELYEGGHDYLWYTNDGVTWKLVMQYTIDPDDPTEYYYVCTTIRGEFVASNGTITYFPAGFYTLMTYTSSSKASTTQCSPVGVDYYMTFSSTWYEASGYSTNNINTLIKILDTQLSSTSTPPVVNTLPTNYSEYHYVWRITVADFNAYGGDDYTKWALYATMDGASNEDMVRVVDNANFGNMVGGLGYKLISWDGTNASFELPDVSAVDPGAYDYLVGTPDNWANESWVRYFLMGAIYRFCSENTAFYGETLGFNFNNYQASFSVNGYGGWMSGYLGSFQAPTDDVDYAFPRVLYLHFSTFGRTEHKVDAHFNNVVIGKKTSIYMMSMAITDLSTVSSYGKVGPLYDVISWSTGSYAIVTDLSTGKRTLCKYTNGTWGSTAL